jgi:hypothetical protein
MIWTSIAKGSSHLKCNSALRAHGIQVRSRAESGWTIKDFVNCGDASDAILGMRLDHASGVMVKY